MSDVPLLIEFTAPTTLHRERDRKSQFPIVRNGPPGTFVMFPDRVRISLPTDQVTFADDASGCARVGFGGMRFTGMVDGYLVFHRDHEIHPDDQLSPERSHVMRLEPQRIRAVYVDGHRAWAPFITENR